MYWFAKKRNGEIITLSEREALLHSENNNISQRLRLDFIGTSDGSKQIDAKKKIGDLIKENRPDNYHTLDNEAKNGIDANIRDKFAGEIKTILDEAFEQELELAKKNGFKQPRKSIRVHTPHGERDKILQSMKL